MITLLLALLVTAPSFAADCPDVLKYRDGSLLKNGDTFYYASGSHLRVGDQIFLPDHSLLRKGSEWYYPGGALLESSGTLYYPEARKPMRVGLSWYYADGQPLKTGERFLYKSRNTARSSGVLYREDGTATLFPVGLEESIGSFGVLRAAVERNNDRVEIVLSDILGTSAEIASSTLQTIVRKDGNTELGVLVDLKTGNPGEVVRLRLSPTSAGCELGSSGLYPSRLVINSPKARVDVRVFDAENVEKVRNALQDALKSLER